MLNTALLKLAALAGAFVGLFLAGCTTLERHPDIPATALMAAEGTERVAYNPSEDGSVYVYDVTAEELIYSGRVKADEIVVVDPATNRITVDQRLVSEESMDAGNAHRIFFAPQGTVEERRIEELRIRERRIEER